MSADEIRRLAEEVGSGATFNADLSIAEALLDYAEMVERCEEIKSKYCLARNRIDKVTSLHPDATYEMVLSKIKEFDYILKGATDERKV